jgi:hypothetical protein
LGVLQNRIISQQFSMEIERFCKTLDFLEISPEPRGKRFENNKTEQGESLSDYSGKFKLTWGKHIFVIIIFSKSLAIYDLIIFFRF